MRGALADRGHPVSIASTGSQAWSIGRQADALCAFVEGAGLTDCYLVCHSMGGLVALAAWERLEHRVRFLLTLGTPFNGTWTGLLTPYTASAREMLPGSALLARLAETRRAVAASGRMWSYSASADQIVPGGGAQGLSAHTRLPELGHCNLFMGPVGIRCVSEHLEHLERLERRAPALADDAMA